MLNAQALFTIGSCKYGYRNKQGRTNCKNNILSQRPVSLLLIEPRVCVCVCAKFYQFLPLRSYFVSKRPENFVRIAKFPYAAFGPLFAFHCPLFFTRNNNLQCKSSRFAVVVRSSVADRQLHLNGVIRSAGVAEWQELGPKT